MIAIAQNRSDLVNELVYLKRRMASDKVKLRAAGNDLFITVGDMTTVLKADVQEEGSVTVNISELISALKDLRKYKRVRLSHKVEPFLDIYAGKEVRTISTLTN